LIILIGNDRRADASCFVRAPEAFASELQFWKLGGRVSK
jgi:hypothetical protein